MKTLYLHGLHAVPSVEKIKLLEETFGLDVIAPELDYEKYLGSLELFDSLVNTIQKESIRIIIGSSFGGYLGFYLSEFCKVPGYLFNPALTEKSIVIPVRQDKSDIKKYIILGKNDETIDPEATKKFIQDGKYNSTFIVEENFAHKTDAKLFGELLEKTDLVHLKK